MADEREPEGRAAGCSPTVALVRERSRALVRLSGVSTSLIAFALILIGGAQALPARSAAPNHQATDPIVGYWNFSGGVIQVSGSASRFTGVVVKETRFSECTHPVGEVIWRITKSGSGYVGTHQYFDDTGSCIPGSGGPGQATWSIAESGGQLVLHACSASPKSGNTVCDDLTRAKPVNPPPAPTPQPPPPKPTPPKPKPPAANRGWLELQVALKPANAKGPLFRVCLAKLGGGKTLCFKLRAGQTLKVTNHRKAVEWPVGMKLQVCVDERDGWVTPGCQTVVIRKGLNHKTIVSRRDTHPPTIKAFEYDDWATRGEKINLTFSVEDDSGKAKVHNTVYQGGRRLGDAVTPLIVANGKRTSWQATVDERLVGPLYFCVWAEDAAGNRSVNDNPDEFEEYRSSCAWIPLVVPVATVSNTCGGEGWSAFVAVQHYFGNKHTFSDSNTNPLAASYEVDFAPACNLHDAGYGGHAVIDTINGNKPLDYRTWSRKRVDAKFLADLRRLCTMQIPASAKVARKNCQARGGNVTIGAEYLFNLVSKIGWNFFDADLTKPGLQKIGHRRNFH